MREVRTSGAVRIEGSSQAIALDDRVYVQGTVGRQPDQLEDPAEPVPYEDLPDLIGGDIQTQTDRAIGNVKAVLAEVDTTLDDVAKTVVYLDDKARFDAMNKVYAERFPEPYPAGRGPP